MKPADLDLHNYKGGDKILNKICAQCSSKLLIAETKGSIAFFFRVFGFVARKQGGISDNSCHLFAELDPDQPASAIVNFVTKIMIGQSKIKS